METGNRNRKPGTDYPISGQMNMTYTYSATQNNGRIVSSADGVTGENVSYTYDSLNRLIAAATSGTTGVQWGDSYSYDGFGNLTSKVVTKGTAPQVYPQVNSATNQARMSGDYGFDANGNWLGSGGSQINTWNVENQLISNGSVDYGENLLTYTYDPWGKRVMQYSVGGVSGPTGTLYFYSITGQRLGTYTLNYLAATQTSVNMYFGGRLLAAVDRLGSVRGNRNGPIAYYPWGEERTATPDGADKYATYFRDSSVAGVGEDYANARYYNNNFGRFWSPDPMGAAHANDPQSWNRYTYGGNDPANNSDPSGLDSIIAPPCGVYAADGTNCLVKLPGPLCFSMAAGEGWEDFGCFADGGGGTGGTQPTQPSRNIPFPECNPGGSRTAMLFNIANLDSQASAVASSVGVPESWVIGWAASETGLSGGVAIVNQNYYNLTGQTSWGGIACPPGSYGAYACFANFQASALAAFTSSVNGLRAAEPRVSRWSQSSRLFTCRTQTQVRPRYFKLSRTPVSTRSALQTTSDTERGSARPSTPTRMPLTA